MHDCDQYDRRCFKCVAGAGLLDWLVLEGTPAEPTSVILCYDDGDEKALVLGEEGWRFGLRWLGKLLEPTKGGRFEWSDGTCSLCVVPSTLVKNGRAEICIGGLVAESRGTGLTTMKGLMDAAEEILKSGLCRAEEVFGVHSLSCWCCRGACQSGCLCAPYSGDLGLENDNGK